MISVISQNASKKTAQILINVEGRRPRNVHTHFAGLEKDGKGNIVEIDGERFGVLIGPSRKMLVGERVPERDKNGKPFYRNIRRALTPQTFVVPMSALKMAPISKQMSARVAA